METIPYQESLKILHEVMQGLHPLPETVPVRQALSRVLSNSVQAQRRNPPYAVAAMDGIAVNCTAIPDALVRLKKDQWRFINTGEVLSDPMNSVIKIEDVQWEDNIPVLDRKPTLYQNVRTPGEDFEKGDLLFTSGHQLQPQDLSLLLAAGCQMVQVFKKPLVTFIPTGSELINSSAVEQEGKILETNSAMIASFVQNWGGDFQITDLVPDDADDLAQTIKMSLKNSEIIVVSAGTSKGTKDLTADVLSLMGKIYFHGVKIAPGKPVLLGAVSGTPVLGLPGFPAAAYVCSQLYLRPMICTLSHVPVTLQRSVYIAAEEIPSRNQDSFYRVNCFEVDGQTFARRTEGGAGSISTISQMDGILHVPSQTAIRKRDGVRIDIVQDRSTNTIAARGIIDSGVSHLFSLLRNLMPTWRLLYWPSSVEDSLQSIVERNVHFAVVSIPAHGLDPLETFAKQIQEPMHRYRAFSRSVGLALREASDGKTLRDLRSELKIAVPKNKLALWQGFLEKEGLPANHFHVFDPVLEEKLLFEVLSASKWDGIFGDVRFLKPDSFLYATTREHIDFVIPESFATLPSIGKLIDLLLSDEYWMWLETQKGCDITQRGLVE